MTNQFGQLDLRVKSQNDTPILHYLISSLDIIILLHAHSHGITTTLFTFISIGSPTSHIPHNLVYKWRISVDFGERSNFISQVVKRNWYVHDWCSHEWKYIFLLTTSEIKFDLPPKSTNILFILCFYKELNIK